MFRLPFVALLSLLSFPCLAETLTEQFSRMDLNKDGFLSEQEFIQGMKQPQAGIPHTEEAPAMEEMSDAEKQKLVDESVAEARKMLPFKVDQATTWTEVYGRKNEIHYVYRIEMDISAMPEAQANLMRPVLEAQICPKVQPAMCGIANDTLLKNGISMISHYNDKTGTPLAECRFTKESCQ
ncbi:MAG: hypothetical protein J5787_07555 [Alphaproteobacteria bacterium]|nr:hypothetical protein [Alphaproteobacteria bacterium]MBO4644173.1 hypothetical protein [Alphaproteobacteria bacterium]